MAEVREDTVPMAAEPTGARIGLHRHVLEPAGRITSNRAQFVVRQARTSPESRTYRIEGFTMRAPLPDGPGRIQQFAVRQSR